LQRHLHETIQDRTLLELSLAINVGPSGCGRKRLRMIDQSLGLFGQLGQKVLPLDLQGIVHELVQAFVIPKGQMAFENHSIKTVQGGDNALGKLGNKTRCELHGVLQRLAV
jgi:hypothetical protein